MTNRRLNMSAFTLASFILLGATVAVPNTQRPLHDTNLEKVEESPKWSALPIRVTIKPHPRSL